MGNWTAYARKGTIEMRPHIPGEDLSGISVSEADRNSGVLHRSGGMIARNPKDKKDQWYIAESYFLDNYVSIPDNG